VGAGVGAAPLIFGRSIVQAAMSSNLEVAASSLLIIDVSSIRETVGTTLSSIVAAIFADQQQVVRWKINVEVKMVSQYRLMRVVKLCIWPLFVAILPAGTWMRAVPGDRIQSRNDQRCLERDEVADVGNVKLKAAKFCKWTCRLF
jgi:hypothetical protein